MAKVITFSLLCFVLMCVQAPFGWAQYKDLPKKPIKFGEIPKEHLLYEKCVYEPDAEAVVLMSYGLLQVSIGHKQSIEYHFRIKILDEKAKDRADILIPYFAANNAEIIIDLEAHTINPRPNGEGFDRFPVTQNQIFDVKLDDKFNQKRFTFPNVGKGSILEYKFTKISNYLLHLEGWTFSQNIPVLYSEYKAQIFSDLTYNVMLQGQRLSHKYINKDSKGVWVLENLSSLKDEPFVPNLEEYAEEVNFQLKEYYNFNTRRYEKIIPTWEKFAADVIKEKSLSGYIDDKDKPKLVFKNLNIEALDDLEKIKTLHQYVRDNFTFNGKFRPSVEQSKKDLERTKQGNSTEINSYLAYLLRQANLKAHLMMMSTLEHGKISKDFPLITQFNHQLVAVQMKDKYLFLDATNPLLPYNLLPVNMLNQQGYLIIPHFSRWENIPTNSAKISIYNNIDLSDLSKPIYQASYKFQDYAAYEIRSIVKSVGLDKFKKAFEKNADLSLETFEVLGLDSLEKPIQIKAKYAFVDLNTDIVYLSPLIWNYIEENPFNTDKRNLPIEFPIKEEIAIVGAIKLPSGYKVQDLPKNQKVLLPEKMGEYSYIIGQVNDMLNLRIKYIREKGILVPEFYTALKEFYTQMIAKQQEQVVLKKNKNN